MLSLYPYSLWKTLSRKIKCLLLLTYKNTYLPVANTVATVIKINLRFMVEEKLYIKPPMDAE